MNDGIVDRVVPRPVSGCFIDEIHLQSVLVVVLFVFLTVVRIVVTYISSDFRGGDKGQDSTCRRYPRIVRICRPRNMRKATHRVHRKNTRVRASVAGATRETVGLVGEYGASGQTQPRVKHLGPALGATRAGQWAVDRSGQ